MGSSIALSSALQACSVSRSASSTIMICQRAADRGERCAADQVAHLVDADRELLGADDGDVGVGALEHGVAAVAVAAAARRSHWSAAANAIAALERPEPGGPVNSQAWVMPRPSTAVRSASTTRCWPTRPSQTLPAGRTSVTVIGAARVEQRLDPLADRGGDLVDREPGVEHDVVVGVGRGEVEERLPRPLVEVGALGLDPVARLRTGPVPARARRRARP